MRLGVDLGGTKTEIIALNDDNGKELYRQRVPSPRDDYRATIDNVVKLVQLAEDTLGHKGTVGIGIPGTISRQTGNVKNANSTWLNGQALDRDLEAALGRPVRCENDANCLALSEATDGAGFGHGNVFAVIIGTGCGAGIVVNGKILGGLNGLGGEWGHNPLPYPRLFQQSGPAPQDAFDRGVDLTARISPIYRHKDAPIMGTDDPTWHEYPGPLCYCGRRGCIEGWISGPAFKADHNRMTGQDLSTHDIIDRMQKNDPLALASFDRYCDRMARALAGVINILDPDIVVLAGGMSNVNALYTRIPAIWDRYIFSDRVVTPLVPARHGDSSGLRGAAWLWNASHE